MFKLNKNIRNISIMMLNGSIKVVICWQEEISTMPKNVSLILIDQILFKEYRLIRFKLKHKIKCLEFPVIKKTYQNMVKMTEKQQKSEFKNKKNWFQRNIVRQERNTINGKDSNKPVKLLKKVSIINKHWYATDKLKMN